MTIIIESIAVDARHSYITYDNIYFDVVATVSIPSVQCSISSALDLSAAQHRSSSVHRKNRVRAGSSTPQGREKLIVRNVSFGRVELRAGLVVVLVVVRQVRNVNLRSLGHPDQLHLLGLAPFPRPLFEMHAQRNV